MLTIKKVTVWTVEIPHKLYDKDSSAFRTSKSAFVTDKQETANDMSIAPASGFISAVVGTKGNGLR